MRALLAGLLLVALVFLLFEWQRPAISTPGIPAPAETASPRPAVSPAVTAPVTAEQPAATTVSTPPSAAPAEAPKPSTAHRPVALFKTSLEPAVYELASGALVTWRSFAAEKPALILFSTHPFLDPLPAGEEKGLKTFVLTASAKELVRRGRFNVADPALLPTQTVSAAIAAGLIGELVFVQPTTREADKVSLTEFQQRAFNAGFLTEAEALALKLKGGVISGTVRGLPFRCVHPAALPEIDRPVIVHVDLGYFKDLFINDVKTPLYDLLYQTARALRSSGWPALAATLSYSNQEADFSLGTRFMISNLATLFLHPGLLDGGTPPSWQLRADARYARSMFAETTADEMTSRAVAIDPGDPDALYALSVQKFIQVEPDEGFALLDRAVAIDPGYAVAYLDLAETAAGKGRLDKAEDLLGKAAEKIPFNPFIRINLADLLIQRHRDREALPLLRELQALRWSARHHPQVPALLDAMLAVATAPPESQPSPPTAPPDDSTKRP